MSHHQGHTAFLHYLFQRAPDGMRCSLDSIHTQQETIELSIANTRGKTIYLKSIEIKFPLGPDTAHTLSGSNNLTYSISPEDTYTVTQKSPGDFLITPKNTKLLAFLDQGIYMRFSDIVMNTTSGAFKVLITETSSDKSNGADTSNKTDWMWFGKYPYKFFMRNLAINKATVAAGESVTLSWIGAYNGNYTMYWNDDQGQQSVDVSNVRVWNSPPLQRSTVFVLEGISVDGDRTTVQLERGVMVSNAPVSTASLTVSGGEARINFAGAPDQTGGLVVNAAGGVGIGTATPAYPLDVVGTVQAQAFVEASDASLKHNIETLPNALAQLLQLRGVRYQRHDTPREEIGFIAQEVEGVFPELVQEDANGLGAVAYSRITAVLVEALKTLNDEVANLKAEIKRLKDGEG